MSNLAVQFGVRVVSSHLAAGAGEGGEAGVPVDRVVHAGLAGHAVPGNNKVGYFLKTES